VANDEARTAALLEYLDAYREWNRARIDSEEATTNMVAAARTALSLGVTIREIKDARKTEDAKAERMTAFD
jgi:hypothetical protein